MDVTPQHLQVQGFELEQYVVRASTGEGRIGWPTGFAGTGWALKLDGEVVFRHAFRLDVINEAERFAAQDVTLGKWNFRGKREVFSGSSYIGHLDDGRLVRDRQTERDPA